MSPEIQILLTKVLGAGLGGLLLFSVLWVTLPSALRQIYNLLRKVRMRELPAFVLLSVFVGGMILHGGSKNNPTNNTPPLLGMSLPHAGGLADNSGTVDQNQTDMRFREQIWAGPESNGLARIEKWFLRGAWEDGQVMTFDNDWRFPYGGEHLSSVEIWSQGGIYPSEKSTNPVVSLVTPLSLKPAETEVFCGRTTNNSYRIEWRNAHPNRDAEQLADAAIELCRNGNCIVTENGVTTVVPYDVPFAHNGFGQDADWVRANFTNAEEILAPGYRNWAEDQIGYNLLNGLYLFTAYFAEDPPEATELYVGDYAVAVTNAGEYVFVLEKGEEYEFGTWPNDVEADYWAQDDMAEDAQILMSWWGYWDSYGTWTSDGGWCWLYNPSEYLGIYYPGIFCWLPTLRGSPDVAHLGPGDFPMTFEAVLEDYCGSSNAEFNWSTHDDNIRIVAPNSQSTLIDVNAMPDWSDFSLSIRASLNGMELFSTIQFCSYGNEEEKPVYFDILSLSILNEQGAELQWDSPVLIGEDIKLGIALKTPCECIADFVDKFSDKISLRTFSVENNATNNIVTVPVTFTSQSVVSVDASSFIVNIDSSFLQDNQIVSKTYDSFQEKTSIDISSETIGQSQRADSDIVDQMPGLLRGMVRGAGNPHAMPPEGSFNERFVQAAGFAFLEASCGDIYSSAYPVQQQADFVYYSGHGSHATAKMMSKIGPSELATYWEDVNVVVIAGCAILDIKEFRASTFPPWSKRKWRSKGGNCSPGEKWESMDLDLYLGYAWYAPRDSEGGIDIATRFKANVIAGQDYITAWRNANDCDEGRNACAIDCRTTPHTYWYWNESVLSGCTWTSVVKGASGW